MMESLNLIRSAAVVLATLGIVVPNAPVMAAGPKPAARPSVQLVDAKVFDIALSKDGIFSGRVVDHTGAALEGAQVTMKQRNKEVARTITDKNGTFAVSNLKGGVYSVSSGFTEGTYRMWAEKAAPPSAKEQGLLVMGQNGARGQFGGFGDGGVLLVGALATAAVVLSAITLSEVNQNGNKIDDLNSKLSDPMATISDSMATVLNIPASP